MKGIFTCVPGCEVDVFTGCDVVKPFQNKRLLATTTTVLNTTTMTSDEQCVMTCYYDKPSCLAVNVITIGDVISCELTTGLSSETDMVDDSTCVLYVTGNQFHIFPAVKQ